MEARKITVIESSKQSKKVIMSEATTLGELKADFMANGIDCTNMDFYEGISKTELKSDSSILPTNVPYKGTTTNELVFMLTTTNKKIASGALSRKGLYEVIKNNNLKDSVKEKIGKPYTNCSTDELKEAVADYITENAVNSAPEIMENAPKSVATFTFSSLCDAIETLKAIVQGLEALSESKKCTAAKEDECPYTEEELAEMFNNID